jgi:hypothetical protein
MKLEPARGAAVPGYPLAGNPGEPSERPELFQDGRPDHGGAHCRGRIRHGESSAKSPRHRFAGTTTPSSFRGTAWARLPPRCCGAKGDPVVGHRGDPRVRVACCNPTLPRNAAVATGRQWPPAPPAGTRSLGTWVFIEGRWYYSQPCESGRLLGRSHDASRPKSELVT